MILSHKHRYIFIKTMKTAGTSVEIALSRFCGPDDIVTPIRPIEPGMEHHVPRNYVGTGTEDQPDFFNHIGASALRELIGDATWDSYYKFCIERSPWERVASLYYFRNQQEPRPPMAEFLENPMVPDLQQRGSDLYLIDGEVAVDRIVRYRALEQDLEEVRLHLGLPEPLVLPQAKAAFRPDGRSYRDLMTDADIATVGEIFSREIDLMGYEA